MKKTVILIALTLSFFSCKQEHHVYSLHSGDITLTVTDFGARVMSLTTPDRGGTPANDNGHNTLHGGYTTSPIPLALLALQKRLPAWCSHLC